MISEEIRGFLSEKYGFEVGDYIVIAKGKNEEDMNYTFSGPTLIMSGMLSWFTTYINIKGFKQDYREEEKVDKPSK